MVRLVRTIRYCCLFLTLCVFTGALLLLSCTLRPFSLKIPSPLSKPNVAYTIDTPGCTIPFMAPDKAVDRFMREEVHVRPCHNPNFNYSLFNTVDLLASNDTYIWIRREHLLNFSFASAVDGARITCCYQSFFRPSIVDLTIEHLDDRVQYNFCKYFTQYIKVEHEFVKVSCKYIENTIYVQYFLFAPWKPLKIDQLQQRRSQKRRKLTAKYNVVVLGIDAVSRLNFYRTMPKTLEILKQKRAVEMLGYNKVGDNTFPNLVSMLMGLAVKDLKKTCIPDAKTYLDNCPFVWNSFKEAGFYTALGEDSGILSTFNFMKSGFLNTPTDYYLYTFMNQADRNVGLNFRGSTHVCMGNRYFYDVLLDYVLSLSKNLKFSNLFGFFWETSLTHDYDNYPTALDESYEKLLKNFDESGYLRRTVVIVLSDHGKRHGKIRLTDQGHLEERLPMLHILLPPSFMHNYRLAYENLLLNSGRLTTPFDMHATLSDLTKLTTIEDESIKERSNSAYALERGISLFLKVGSNRTCKAAGIEDHWCTCHHERQLPVESGEAREAAVYLMRHLNALLELWTQCARLQLAEVLAAAELQAGASQPHLMGWSEYRVTARAQPGDGVFDATLRRDSRGNWSTSGAVSRLNLYGTQSFCVHDAQIKLYCYCL